MGIGYKAGVSDYVWFMILKAVLLIVAAGAYGYWRGYSRGRRQQSQAQPSQTPQVPADPR
jgi:hypothetical protein